MSDTAGIDEGLDPATPSQDHLSPHEALIEPGGANIEATYPVATTGQTPDGDRLRGQTPDPLRKKRPTPSHESIATKPNDPIEPSALRNLPNIPIRPFAEILGHVADRTTRPLAVRGTLTPPPLLIRHWRGDPTRKPDGEMVVEATRELASLSDPHQLKGDTTTSGPFAIAVHQLGDIPRGPFGPLTIGKRDESTAKPYAGLSERRLDGVARRQDRTTKAGMTDFLRIKRDDAGRRALRSMIRLTC